MKISFYLGICIRLVLSSLLAGSGMSQTSGENGSLKRFGDSLTARGIELTEPSLIAALHNSDGEIRSLAALKLAEDRDLDAIPSIEGALLVEKDPKTSIGMASALRTLGDPKGVAYLTTMCADTSLPIDVITQLVWYLHIFGASTAPCADTILTYLNRSGDSAYRDEIFSLLPALYGDVPKDQSDQILRIIQNNLTDESQTATRLEAGHTLARIESPASIKILQEAISREQDPFVRASLQDDLNAVLKKR